ncbi:sugar phosphate isomerase/epimerase family protein [Streptomyces sp. NPDC088387]|uniref:sugar phosphate isomerase/epimerase family protein n=1 Tax=Streptomyces sp. NPDC088387 TaxID=3365859 RepID=UPI0037F64EBD
MRVLVLTKPFGALSPQTLADQLVQAGADGADLLVRDGQTVTPDTPERIAETARALHTHGCEIGFLTTDLTSAGREADRVLGHCADAGVTRMRVGFYRYDAGSDHPADLDRARRDLAGLADLAARHGVRPVLALHHGTLHPSAAHAMRLLDGRDDVLVHPDPGNQAKEGSEHWRLTLDTLGGPDRVGCVGVKNALWEQGGSPEDWTCRWQPLADGGVVPWPTILAGLTGLGYSGPLSLHVHYPAADPFAAVRRDVRYLRGLLTAAGATPSDPTTTPTGPGTTPTDPATTPTGPGTTPTDPATTPTGPGTEPSWKATRPTSPRTTPTGPGTTPTGPTTAPTGPATAPTAPGTTPTDPATTPTGPGAEPFAR